MYTKLPVKALNATKSYCKIRMKTNLIKSTDLDRVSPFYSLSLIMLGFPFISPSWKLILVHLYHTLNLKQKRNKNTAFVGSATNVKELLLYIFE